MYSRTLLVASILADTHDLLRTGCHEDATRKTGPVEFQI